MPGPNGPEVVQKLKEWGFRITEYFSVGTGLEHCLQRARVAIYCGHRLQAVSDIRAAGQQLRASGAKVSPETLAGLRQAYLETEGDLEAGT